MSSSFAITAGEGLSNDDLHRRLVRPRCPVCGFATREAVCPRCSTILVRDRAICPRCGKILKGWIAACDDCGASVPAAGKEEPSPGAVTALGSVPGISEARAKELAAQGFRDFADIVRLALPEEAVRKGLHHAIARKVLLSALGSKPEQRMQGAPCPTCGTPWLPGQGWCRACGSAGDRNLDVDAFEEKLRQVTGEIVDLAQDPDFQEMPEAVREELLEAFGGLDEEELLREEYQRQIEAWRRKGFDVEPLERLLDENPAGFEGKGVRLIRAQMMKKTEDGLFRCPLCEVRLASSVEECSNCGARFA